MKYNPEPNLVGKDFSKESVIDILDDILTYCGLVMAYGTQIWAYIGPGNGLLPEHTKPLPEQMLICQ